MASQSPSNLGIGADIKWTIPTGIASRADVDSVKIWRSAENSGYEEIDSISYSHLPIL